MKVAVLEKTKQKMKLKVTQANTGFVNALRRAIIKDLPSFAVQNVTFYENKSKLFNEYIAHRIGLIPLSYAQASDNYEVILTLDKMGPCTVFSGDLQSTDQNVKPVIENIPIIKLYENESLRLEAVAVKGTGQKHAKFQCAFAYYSALPNVKRSSKFEANSAVAGACPKKIVGKDGKISEPENCTLCNACVEADPNKALSIEPSETDFIFTVETYNNVMPRDQLTAALEIMEKKAEKMEKVC